MGGGKNAIIHLCGHGPLSIIVSFYFTIKCLSLSFSSSAYGERMFHNISVGFSPNENEECFQGISFAVKVEVGDISPGIRLGLI